MKWFYDIKIAAKIIIGFILLASLVAVVGVIGSISVKVADDSDTELYEKNIIPIADLGQMMLCYQNLLSYAQDIVYVNEPQAIKEIGDKISAEKSALNETISRYEQEGITSEKMKATLQDFIDKNNAFQKELDTVMALAVQNKDAEAKALLVGTGSAGITAKASQMALGNMVNMKVENGKNKAEANTVQAYRAITMIAIISIGSVILAIAMGLFISMIISKPIKKTSDMLKEMSLGHFALRLNMEQKDEIGEMAQSLDDFCNDIQTVVIGSMRQLSDGDVSVDIKPRDDQDELMPALKQTIETIRALITEMNALSQDTSEGRLEIRGNAAAFKGGFREVVEGVNKTLDAVVEPLNLAADYVKQIGKGVIPTKITGTYHGDFNSLISSINACIEGLTALTEGNRVLGKLSLNDYSEIMEGQYLGIYAEIAESINKVQERMTRVVEVCTNMSNGDLHDLGLLRQIGRRSENDTLLPSLIGMLENISGLVEETENMAVIAVDGDLNNRGEVSRFPGEYGKIITGFNKTLDAVVAPIQEASITLGELVNGNLNTRMTGDYCRDHAKIKEDLNQTIAFLSGYVEEVAITLEAIGQRNLNIEITTTYPGDFAAVKNSLNEITTSLSEILTDIDIAAGQVEVGARQISDGGQALSQGATEQASTIEELTASIEEVSNETKKNAVRANEASELTDYARSNAEVGNDRMENLINAMREINESSSNISKIIKVIDDIAFQTNILALNAAVEAARAGQHGKGFAVVAEEVRTLAARSAIAVEETTALIEGSVDKVEMGTKIADETAESLKEILAEIKRVTHLAGEIAQASNEQAAEIAEITQGVSQVSQVVQTNSATAEETAASSEELTGQAELVKAMIETFKIKDKKKNGTGIREMNVSSTTRPKESDSSRSEIVMASIETDKY